MAQPIRILFLDHTAALGGGEIALLNLINFIDRSWIQPLALLGADGPLASKLGGTCQVTVMALPDQVGKAKKDSLGIRSLLKLREITAAFAYVRGIYRFIKANKVDLIHTNSLKADILGGIAGRLARTPVVWHVRDRIEPDYLPAIVVRVFRLLSRLIPSYVIANSRATLATLLLPPTRPGSSIPSGVVLQTAAGVVHDGLDLSATVEVGNLHQYPVIGLIGRICPWKGQHIFIEAAKIVHARFPLVRFEIIGAPLFGEHEYESELRRQCSDLNLNHVVRFTGFTSEIAAAISRLTIVVHASTTGEPFGQVIIEGMAAGKPVIATNGGGVPEIVVDGETGILVPMNDAAAMADAMCSLLSDPARAKAMGRQGLLRVRDHFTVEKTARAVEDVYRTVLGLKKLSLEGVKEIV